MTTISEAYRSMLLAEELKIKTKSENETEADTDGDENVPKEKAKGDPAAIKPNDGEGEVKPKAIPEKKQKVSEGAKENREADAKKAKAKTKDADRGFDQDGQLKRNKGNLSDFQEAFGEDDWVHINRTGVSDMPSKDHVIGYSKALKNQNASPKLKKGANSAMRIGVAKKKGYVIKEASGDKEAYKKFFTAAMKKFGVTEPDQLKGDKEKEFYDYVDANWEADDEVAESRIRSKTLRDLVNELTNKR